jgi:hypothetical protein
MAEADFRDALDVPAHQSLNEIHDMFPQTSELPDDVTRSLNYANRAAYGISAITRILDASAVQENCHNGTPLNGYVAGGLVSATRVMAEMLSNELENLAEAMAKRGRLRTAS